jgi:hypothetical protein
MNKTLEDEFFSLYSERPGAAAYSVDWVEWQFNLIGWTNEARAAATDVKARYSEIATKLTEFDTTQFTDMLLPDDLRKPINNPLMNEIVRNIEEAEGKGDAALRRYVFSLITPFQYVQGKIMKHYEKHERLRLFHGNFAPLALRTHGVLMWLKLVYTNQLDAVLLMHEVSLMKMQNEAGVDLQVERDINVIGELVGTRKLADSYIKAAEGGGIVVPWQLNTKEAEAALSKLEKVKIITRGNEEKPIIDRSCFPWKFASKSLAAYIAKTFQSKGIVTDNRHWAVFEKVGNYARLQDTNDKQPAPKGAIDVDKALK